MEILQTIRGHKDLVNLSDGARTQLCREIREYLVENVAKTGGHLASNLGVVELTVAIETVYNTMEDRLVFDVGHQSYVHKLLTGRQADFLHLRQFGGISGFPKPAESDADAFVAGHASSSVSIALGMARARTLLKQNYQVVALIGDGAVTGGMAYEGLNDAAVSREPMVIILNDNEMSIDRNVGGMSRHLSRLRTKDRYLGMKKKYRSILRSLPGGKGIYRITKSLKNRLKRMLLPTTIFENMGMTYLGPMDGHDLPGLITLLRTARDLKEPVLVHVITQKGKGYAPAEQEPSRFHGIGGFDPASGKSLSGKVETYSDAFGEVMVELAEKNPRVCAVTAAMPGGTGLLPFKEKFPNRLFDVGIAEEHAVSMAGGLAKQGMVPVVALYSTFLQRSYDQIIQDVALQGLHVVFAVDRAGLVGEDGPTHHGVFDVGFLRQIPGMMVLCPANRQELKVMMRWAVNEYTGPVAIRYPRGFEGYGDLSFFQGDPSGIAHSFSKGEEATILSYGYTTVPALSAVRMLSNETLGEEIRVHGISLYSVTHYSKELLVSQIRGGHVFVVEEVCHGSGISGEIALLLQEYNIPAKVHAIDLGGNFTTHGSLHDLHETVGLDGRSIANYVREVLLHEN